MLSRLAALSFFLPVVAIAADYRDCRELFVSPLLARIPDAKTNGYPWDDGSPADPQVTAWVGDTVSPRFIVGAKQQDTASPRWNTLFLDATSTGSWMPVRVADEITLMVTDRDALSDDQIAVFKTSVPKELAQSGLIYQTLATSDRSTVLALRISASDGARTCRGVDEPATISVNLPKEGIGALPDVELFESVRKHNRCNVNGTAPACARSNYEAIFADVNEDGIHDTIIRGGPFGPARAFVLGFALGFEPGKRQTPVVLDCDDAGILKAGELTCTSGGTMTVVDMRKGSEGVRQASASEVKLAGAATGAARAEEAKVVLTGLHTAQSVLRASTDRYANAFPALDFKISKNRYHYFLAARGPIASVQNARVENAVIFAADSQLYPDAKLPSGLKEAGCPLTFGVNADGEPVGLGVTGAGTEQHYVIYAIGNVDDDADNDCWSISSIERRTAVGVVVPAGVPHHEKSDFELAPTRKPKG